MRANTITPSVYHIPAVTAKLNRYGSTPEDVQLLHRQQLLARKHGVAALLRTLFPDWEMTVTADDDVINYDRLPWILFKEVGHRFEIRWVSGRYDAHPTALQLRYNWGYRSIMRRLTLKVDGDSYTIDKAKADKAAADIIAERKRILDAEVARATNADIQKTKDRAEFTAVTQILAQQGITVEPDHDGTGGVIFVGSGYSVARIDIRGNRAVLKASQYSNSPLPIKVELIPDFVALLKRNLAD